MCTPHPFTHKASRQKHRHDSWISSVLQLYHWGEILCLKQSCILPYSTRNSLMGHIFPPDTCPEDAVTGYHMIKSSVHNLWCCFFATLWKGTLLQKMKLATLLPATKVSFSRTAIYRKASLPKIFISYVCIWAIYIHNWLLLYHTNIWNT